MNTQASYTSLTVTAIPSNRQPGQVVGFIGQQLVFFERDSRQPAVNETVPVMLTRPLWRVGSGGEFNLDELMSILVREVTDDYVLIEHDGFEYNPSTKTTLARAVGLDFPLWISPGRTGVYVAHPDERGLIVPRPGAVYVLKDQVYERTQPDDQPVVRCEGLASWQDAIYAALVKE